MQRNVSIHTAPQPYRNGDVTLRYGMVEMGLRNFYARQRCTDATTSGQF